ncbi:MAG TPA: tripartite tricarboxylate transporter substrate binding protein [Xanthobacteraceae bacterium]|nr:tripartite tricarboxylate transporter substrate binding protein [Xanthobacteraceae bacterium]
MKQLISRLAVLAGATALLAGAAQAQGAKDPAANFPDRAIRIIVPFPAGGATDIIARLIAEKMTGYWKQAVVIDNVAGATGMTGTAQGARAAADGYTITATVGTTTSLLANLRSKIPYEPMTDLEPLALVVTFPNILAVRNEIPAKSVQELADIAKANPGKYSFASSGFGSSIHIAGEWFKTATKTDMLHVPFTGSAPALNALLGGHVDMIFDTLPSIYPLVQDGRLRALGVGTPKRIESMKDIPAIAETIPGFDVASWEGFAVPKGTPPEIGKKISDAIIKAMNEPDMAEKLAKVGALPDVRGPEEFKAFMKADYDKWQRVAKDTGIKLD